MPREGPANQRSHTKRLKIDKEDTQTRDGSQSDVHSVQDRGHRYGNFHQYYSFHPVESRITVLGSIFEVIGSTFRKQEFQQQIDYLDIGCNSGDLTIRVAVSIADASSRRVRALGWDLDDQLIARANDKSTPANATTTFETINVLNEGFTTSSSLSDVTTIFSTTMWIHIHGGDEGLRRVMDKLFKVTRHFLIVEPQPSKCYKVAAARLRRMGLSPDDVSVDRLHLRLGGNVEEEIQRLATLNGFDLVVKTAKTEWKRTVYLFHRRAPLLCTDNEPRVA